MDFDLFRHGTKVSGFLERLRQLLLMRPLDREQQSTQAVNEVAEILAAGLMRVLAPKSSELSPAAGESSLDFTAHQSGHRPPASRRKRDG
jgi:hypothetical protein